MITMSLLDLEPGLRSRCILAIWNESAMFNFLKTLKKVVPAHALMSEGKTLLRLYVDAEGLEAESVSTLEKSGAALSLGNYVVTMTLDKQNDLNLIGDIIHQHKVVVNSTYVSDGWLMFDFRFHSSRYREISTLISKYLGTDSAVKLVYLGPSPGLISMLSKLNESLPLSILQFEVETKERQELPWHVEPGETVLLESTNLFKEGSGANFIAYRASGGVITDIGEISINNPLLVAVRTGADKANIARYNTFIRIGEDDVVVMMFLPSNLLHSYLKMLISTSRKFVKGGVNLIASSPFSLEVIDSFD